MKIIICGDTHIGAVFGLGGPNGKGGNTRVDDYEKTLNFIVNYAIENNADAFIQTGDAFDSRTPSPEHMAVLNRAIKRLSMANITSVIIMGNHDYRRSGDIFTSAISSLAAKDYPNVRIILEPQVMKFHDKDGNGADVVLIPYRDRRMYAGKSVKEDSEAYEFEVSNLIDSCTGKVPIFAVGHNFFYSGSYNDFSSHEIMAKIDTFKKCDVVIMGHLHQFRIVKKKNPIAIYSGSMEKLNFGDEKVDKFFIDYDTKTKKNTIVKVPSRELADLKIDLSECSHDDLIKTLQEKISKLTLNDKIIRARVSVKDNLISFIRKNTIESLLYEAKAFYVSKVIVEPIFNRIVRDEAILNKKDNFSMFEAFVNDQNLDKDLMKEILKEAKNIVI
jgi:exonuclease SbcD